MFGTVPSHSHRCEKNGAFGWKERCIWLDGPKFFILAISKLRAFQLQPSNMAGWLNTSRRPPNLSPDGGKNSSFETPSLPRSNPAAYRDRPWRVVNRNRTQEEAAHKPRFSHPKCLCPNCSTELNDTNTVRQYASTSVQSTTQSQGRVTVTAFVRKSGGLEWNLQGQ